MHKPKDYTLLALAIPVIISLGFNFGIAIENKAASKIIPAQSDTLQYVEYFKDGDILPPESPCGGDTLIVKDAYNLNIALSDYEQTNKYYSEAQLDSIFKRYCIVK